MQLTAGRQLSIGVIISGAKLSDFQISDLKRDLSLALKVWCRYFNAIFAGLVTIDLNRYPLQ
jgi:hypothetical protein